MERTKIYTDNRHRGISAKEMGEREKRERWARAEDSGTMLQPHFNFYLGFDQVIIDDLSRIFASLPCPSIGYHFVCNNLPVFLHKTFDHTGEITRVVSSA